MEHFASEIATAKVVIDFELLKPYVIFKWLKNYFQWLFSTCVFLVRRDGTLSYTLLLNKYMIHHTYTWFVRFGTLRVGGTLGVYTHSGSVHNWEPCCPAFHTSPTFIPHINPFHDLLLSPQRICIISTIQIKLCPLFPPGSDANLILSRVNIWQYVLDDSLIHEMATNCSLDVQGDILISQDLLDAIDSTVNIISPSQCDGIVLIAFVFYHTF